MMSGDEIYPDEVTSGLEEEDQCPGWCPSRAGGDHDHRDPFRDLRAQRDERARAILAGEVPAWGSKPDIDAVEDALERADLEED
jgi:hypothetical protein